MANSTLRLMQNKNIYLLWSLICIHPFLEHFQIEKQDSCLKEKEEQARDADKRRDKEQEEAGLASLSAK